MCVTFTSSVVSPMQEIFCIGPNSRKMDSAIRMSSFSTMMQGQEMLYFESQDIPTLVMQGITSTHAEAA